MQKRKKDVPDFDLAIIDADSLMYSIAWVTPNQRMAEKLLMSQVEEMIRATEVEQAYVYIKGRDNFRYQVDPNYKANRRVSMDPEVLDRIELLYSFARKNFIESHQGEADDYASIHVYNALGEGLMPVVCHIDKDLNMIPGWHYNFKKKEYYYVSPPESFTFMCRQLLAGDMSSDNIPGLKGVGDITAAKILHNRYLSEMREHILKKWTGPDYKVSTGEISSEDKRRRFFQSANCLILREEISELRPLTEDEILRKMTWTDKETDYLFHKDRDVTDEMVYNSLPITSYMDTKRPVRCKEHETAVIGKTSPAKKTSTRRTTSDSSTESPSS